MSGDTYGDAFDDPYDALEGTDALFVFTEWEGFGDTNLERLVSCMHNPVVLDGRNVFCAEAMAEANITYISIGRPRTGDLTAYARTA